MSERSAKQTARNSGLRSVLKKRRILSVPKPRFHVDTARAFMCSAMTNFDKDFACRSLLGLQANSIEDSRLYITTNNFTGLDGEF